MKNGKILIILGLLLIAAAFGLLFYNLYDSRRAEEEGDAVLEKLMPQIEEAIETAPAVRPDAPTLPLETEEERIDSPQKQKPVEYPDYVLNPEMEPPSVEIDGDRYIGILAIPSLGKTYPVQKTCSEAKLKHSPCTYAGSPYQNDFIIAAHNYVAHFAKLGQVRIGDDVNFTDLDGNVFVYEVVEIENLPADAVEEMLAGDWDLTLFTCTVTRQERITVRCRLR